ncbi:response regulator transcription factor [Spongiactinospora sp. TRM90649]|uniref:response regulator transcription factor n=1 Tax=Spongiactinospora sp. TRM90649 TaxID=3031114 RepID=UPI0023F63EDD|nr:response regulator transcription factor [Spongiactinospora sp. TRM90649]MDF5756336.1 response regulator transcription factor [Spongiactinospora sp. TRM90649]
MISVLLVEDQHLVRGALAALLSLEPDITVVAEASDGQTGVRAALEHRPDVVLMDIELPVLDGIEAARRIREALPATKVIMLTTFGRPGYLRRAMDAGASGFVLKDSRPGRLTDSVRKVADGRTVVDPDLAVASLESGADPLNERERDVLRVAATGATVADIAKELTLSSGTVRNYLSSAISKTRARNRVDAALIARDKGWL